VDDSARGVGELVVVGLSLPLVPLVKAASQGDGSTRLFPCRIRGKPASISGPGRPSVCRHAAPPGGSWG